MAPEHDHPDERELLGRELAKLTGPAASSLSGLVGPALGLDVSDEAIEAGTARGARRGARFTKVDRAEVELDLAAPPDAVLQAAFAVLREIGELRELELHAEAPHVAGIVAAGLGRLNPVLVVVGVVPAGGGTRARVTAGALEGLIRQHAAPKTARRVADLLGDAVAGG